MEWGHIKVTRPSYFVRVPYYFGLTVPKLSYLGEHSEVSQAWSLHACWTRMLYNDRLETIDNSQSTNYNHVTLYIITLYITWLYIITTWHLLRSPKNLMLYCRLIYMLSILCVRLTIKVKVGKPESFKVGWYAPQKAGSSHLKCLIF